MDRDRSRRYRALALPLVFLICDAAWAINPAPLEDGYWRFEEGPLGDPVVVVADYLWDATGNGNHMQTQNTNTAPVFVSDVPAAVVPATGEANTLALWFDGIQLEGEGDEIFTASKPIDNPTNVVAFTMEASFKLDQVITGSEHNQSIFGKDSNVREDGQPTATFRVRGDSNFVEWQQVDRMSNLVSVIGHTRVAADRWYHAAVVNNGTNVTVYLDSNDGLGYVEQGSAVVDGALFQFEGRADPPYAWVVGRSMLAGLKVDFTAGVIDEVRLSTNALDRTEFLFYAAPPDLAVTSIEKLPGSELRVVFEDSDPGGETYGLAGSSSPAGPFTEETEADITDLGAGRIQADVPTDAHVARYYRGTATD